MFGKRGKLNSQFIGLFEVLDMIDTSVYKITLLLKLFKVHNVSHVSMMRKYNHNLLLVLSFKLLPLSDDLFYKDIPIRILDRKEKVIRKKIISFVKVL